MAQQNKTTLKSYYQTGDIPTSGQYGGLIDSSINLAETAVQIGECSISSSGNIRLLGSSSFIGDVTASGDISASSASTITGGTGSFSNLFEMNQAVRTTDNVTFNQISLSKTTLSSDTWGASVEASGQSFTITLLGIPIIIGATLGGIVTRASNPSTVSNPSVSLSSVIIGSSTSELSIHPYRVSSGQFKFQIANESTTAFTAGAAVFNFTIF